MWQKKIFFTNPTSWQFFVYVSVPHFLISATSEGRRKAEWHTHSGHVINITNFEKMGRFPVATTSDVILGLGPWLSLRTNWQSLVLALALRSESLLTSLVGLTIHLISMKSKLHYWTRKRKSKNSVVGLSTTYNMTQRTQQEDAVTLLTSARFCYIAGRRQLCYYNVFCNRL